MTKVTGKIMTSPREYSPMSHSHRQNQFYDDHGLTDGPADRVTLALLEAADHNSQLKNISSN